MITRRLLETVGMMIIGDSFLCVLSPRRHTKLWLDGPRWWQRMWGPLVDRPELVRVLGMLGMGVGVWWAWRQEDETADTATPPGMASATMPKPVKRAASRIKEMVS